MDGFQESLCGCFSNIPICLIVTFVPFGSCAVQAIAHDHATKEGIMAPLIPIILTGCIGCCCLGFAMNRGKIRIKYNLNGATCDDICTHYCCSPCAVCQEYREVKKRMKHGG
jgi:Cys-rich protein (TIGR01571 family)